MKKQHRGGKRDGAGRPVGSGRYGEPTKAMRIPQSLIDSVQHFLSTYGQEKETSSCTTLFPPNAFSVSSLSNPALQRPLYDSKVAAGFPSPADDHLESQLDLNEYVVRNPATTFYVRVEGNSMLNAGIHPNDILVVDLSLEPHDGNIVIALVNGEFTVKRLKILPSKQICLMPENEDYSPIMIQEGMDFRVWGIVTNVIHTLLQN